MVSRPARFALSIGWAVLAVGWLALVCYSGGGGFGVAGFGVGVVGISRLSTCSNGRDESSVVEKLWSGFISNS